ncbi:hypothetical protein GCM10007939_20810 [Amylibacter marinus]|uniref:Uncharacterized protein n=1 Tax=Amylibacter marinus TaxID=1475483 RepID=A0ABQ5VWH2_9RHOB|nr:hypothetical protein [Amylibacter marinus]GLQ35798.1 hypothetical protein GCM10007939_20810 [Amylibacter marinus]
MESKEPKKKQWITPTLEADLIDKETHSGAPIFFGREDVVYRPS